MEYIYKKGFKLNPNPKIVENITTRIINNGGKCICKKDSVDPHCPCSDFREKGICHCSLYVKDE